MFSSFKWSYKESSTAALVEMDKGRLNGAATEKPLSVL